LKYYLSGVSGKRGPADDRISKALECRLLSCHAQYINVALQWVEYANDPDSAITKIMLDSGAFTAWSKGHNVELKNLIRDYHKVVDKIDRTKIDVFLINLDRIPGSPGRTATNEEVRDAIAESDRNFEILTKEFGDIVLPVLHQGESESRLLEVQDMASYICVSPRNDLPEWTRVTWAEEVHRKLKPGIKTHGLATTGDNMLARVPWYSVDSAAWGWTGAMGKVNVLKPDGTWLAINVSVESPDRYVAGKHYDNSPQPVRDIVDARCAYHDIPVEMIRTCMTTRKLLIGLEITEWLKTYKYEGTTFQQSLFDL
jgi:hypothetical protein